MPLVKVQQVPKRKRAGGGPGREPRMLDTVKELVGIGVEYDEDGNVQWYEVETHAEENRSRATTARASFITSAKRLNLKDQGLWVESTTRTNDGEGEHDAGSVTVYVALVEYDAEKHDPKEDESAEAEEAEYVDETDDDETDEWFEDEE